MAKILIVIPPERFRDEELFVPKTELEKSNHTVVIASTKKGRCDGSRGGHINSEILLEEVNIKDFDGVIFVGGGGSKLLFNNQPALNIAKEAGKNSRVIGAICLAPVILANAGVLKGKKATVCGTEVKTIEVRGGNYTGPGVTVDDKVVTANGPKSAFIFAQKIISLLND